MAKTVLLLPADIEEFLSQNALCKLTTPRADGSPRVTPVRFTRDSEAGLARIMTAGSRCKARNFTGDLHACASLCHPVLLHGDLWRDNVLAGQTGRPTLIDPAIWYGWAEVDISMMWLSPRPAASDRFFETWEAIARPEPGWTDRAPLLHIREMLSVLAQFGDEYGTADRLRAVLTPFRRRSRRRRPNSALRP